MEERKIEEIDDELEVFDARVDIFEGKKTLVIKPKIRNIVHPDGRKDVIIRVPSLGLINKIKKEKGIE